MQKKLTLLMDNALIEQAKQYAQERGFSLSQLVAEYFTVLTVQSGDENDFENSLPPITRSLVGILQGSDFDVEDYHCYLEEKYG